MPDTLDETEAAAARAHALEHDIAPRAAALWGGQRGPITHIRTGESAVFRFERAEGGSAILRLTAPAHRSVALLEAECAFVRYLAEHGVAVPAPLASPSSRLAEVIGSGDHVTHVTAFEYVEGNNKQFFSEELDQAFFARLGATLAAIHRASEGYTPAPGHERYRWRDDYVLRLCLDAPDDFEPEAAVVLGALVEELEALPVSPASFGLVHGDLGLSNMIVTDDALVAIDFDDACYHWYVADIAYSLWSFRHAPRDVRADYREWFLEGYRALRPIEEAELERLSLFVRYRWAFMFFQFQLRGWGGPPDQTDEQREAWLDRERALLLAPFAW